jgi:L-lactate dehydrogenase complex protein LldF
MNDRLNDVPAPTAPVRSTAMTDAGRVTRPHPSWSGSDLDPEQRPSLRSMTREAVSAEGVGHTRIRLEVLGRARASGHWSPWEAGLRERGAEIRRETLQDFETYLSRLTSQLESHGVIVHRVATAQEARETIGRIATEHGITLVAKSKSMATEEIHLTPHLVGLGVDVVETDLGEYIAQVAGERPSHIVGPALHMSRQDVTDLFSQMNGEPLPADPDVLASYARERLRADFKAAQMGICGVNFAAADTGTLVVVSNEGNVDMVTSQPDLLVAVMPVEKVIPRLADIGTLVPLLCNAANKELTTAYQTLLSGPRRPGETDGPSEFHCVIFDNGRTALLGTPKEEILACIRCGNCQFSCPVFRTLGGGHAYGTTYGGPIGAVLSPLLGDASHDRDLPFLCSLCGACADACPVKIPLPDLLVDGRADYEAEQAGGVEALGWSLWSRLWSRPLLYRASRTAARVVGRILPRAFLGRLPVANLWATGRTVPDMSHAGEYPRRARR